MRHVHVLETCILVAATGIMLAASVLLSDGLAVAGDRTQDSCSCPQSEGRASRPKFADLTRPLDESDEIAALESIQVGLSRMDDGTPFVWRRANGLLSGIVRPTASFRNPSGALCRHVVVLLTTGFKTRTAEGVACRLENRRWVLEG